DRFAGVARGDRPPAETQQPRLQLRMRPARGEALEGALRVAILADAPERLAVPEGDVAHDRRGHRARLQRGPGFLRFLETAEAIEREAEPVTGPPFERRGHRRRGETGEDVARARRITHAERGPPAAGLRPHRQRLARLLRDLTEERVGEIGTPEDVVRF